jgi:prophage regulatory protein
MNARIRSKRVSPIQFDPARERIMRRREVQQTTGLSRSSLYRLVAAGSFPTPIQLSTNAVGWLATEICAWVAGRVAATRDGNARPASSQEAS